LQGLEKSQCQSEFSENFPSFASIFSPHKIPRFFFSSGFPNSEKRPVFLAALRCEATALEVFVRQEAHNGTRQIATHVGDFSRRTKNQQKLGFCVFFLKRREQQKG